MKQKRKNQILENITVGDMVAEGKCIVRHNDKVIFVEGAAPQDVVDLRITKDKKSFAEAVVTHIHEYSPLREVPFCEHFGTCGGCKWQHLGYNDQLRFKHQQVVDNLERIAKVDLPAINPILPSKETTFYRNKLEFTFSCNKWMTSEEISSGEKINKNALGFHIPKRFDKILDIKHCYLQPEPSNAIRLEVKRYAEEHNLEFFELVNQSGFLRNLIIRTSSTGELMVIVQFYRNDEKEINGLMEHLANKFPQITSLLYIVNSKQNDTWYDQDVITYKGRDHIFEEMEGLRFRIGPKSFYQTNAAQAYELYKIARDYAGLTGSEVVYDLYTGTGTIANFVAQEAKKVIGLEYVEMAIDDAKINSLINGIENTEFYAGDIKDLLNKEFISKHGKPDIVITDPPRAGMHPDVVEVLMEAAPQKIVYISCNPATQARDLALMDQHYKVSAVQPVDMFPHTYHVENVVLLERK
jgi:23S rRNA (uracil1939-C5)-methyltransferase